MWQRIQRAFAWEHEFSWPREIALFLPVYFFLSFCNLRAKLILTPAWFDGHLTDNHRSLLEFTYTNNEQSRLLQFAIPEFFHRVLFVSIEDAYVLQRLLFTCLAFVVFHLYLRKWFTTLASLAGVAFLAAVMQLVLMNDLQESGPLLLLTYVAGLWCIRERKDLAFAIILCIGALNNETMLSLSAVFLFVRWEDWRVSNVVRVCLRSILVSLPAWGSVGIIRFITRDNPHLGDPFQLPANIAGILQSFQIPLIKWYGVPFLLPLFVFGFFWLYAALAWRTVDPFLRRSSLMIPLFLLVHLLTGVISESRQMLPLGFIIIPMAMLYLREKTSKEL